MSPGNEGARMRGHFGDDALELDGAACVVEFVFDRHLSFVGDLQLRNCVASKIRN